MNTLPENCMEEKALTVEEVSQLKAFEKTIKASDMAFIDKGKALEGIREKRLYRTNGGRTWEGYCREVWDMGQQYADRLVKAANVIENLKPIANKFALEVSKVTPIGVKTEEAINTLLPLNESQARELSHLAQEGQQVVWQQLLEKKIATTDGEKPFRITAMAVTKAVAEYKGKKFNETIDRTRKTIGSNREAFKSEEFVSAWENFLSRLEEERRQNWRHTSRSVIFDLLSSLTSTVGEVGKKDIAKPSIEYQQTDLEKLKAAGLSIFRINSERNDLYLIEQWDHGDSWLYHSQFETPGEVEEAFSELMKEPTNIQA